MYLTSLLRNRPLTVCVLTTILSGLAMIGLGVASVMAGSGRLGAGVAIFLAGYGVVLLVEAWFAARGHSWALGLIVASSLLHTLIVGSFLTTSDRGQFIGSLIVTPIVLTGLVTALLARHRMAPPRE